MCLFIHTTGSRSKEAIIHDVQELQCLLAGVLLEVNTQSVLLPPRTDVKRCPFIEYLSKQSSLEK